jgi:hypothetical protein
MPADTDSATPGAFVARVSDDDCDRGISTTTTDTTIAAVTE